MKKLLQEIGKLYKDVENIICRYRHGPELNLDATPEEAAAMLEQALDDAIGKYPDVVNFYFMKSQLKTWLKQYNEAVGLIQKVMELDKNPRYTFLLENLQKHKQREDELRLKKARQAEQKRKAPANSVKTWVQADTATGYGLVVNFENKESLRNVMETILKKLTKKFVDENDGLISWSFGWMDDEEFEEHDPEYNNSEIHNDEQYFFSLICHYPEFRPMVAEYVKKLQKIEKTADNELYSESESWPVDNAIYPLATADFSFLPVYTRIAAQTDTEHDVWRQTDSIKLIRKWGLCPETVELYAVVFLSFSHVWGGQNPLPEIKSIFPDNKLFNLLLGYFSNAYKNSFYYKRLFDKACKEITKRLFTDFMTFVLPEEMQPQAQTWANHTFYLIDNGIPLTKKNIDSLQNGTFDKLEWPLNLWTPNNDFFTQLINLLINSEKAALLETLSGYIKTELTEQHLRNSFTFKHQLYYTTQTDVQLLACNATGDTYYHGEAAFFLTIDFEQNTLVIDEYEEDLPFHNKIEVSVNISFYEEVLLLMEKHHINLSMPAGRTTGCNISTLQFVTDTAFADNSRDQVFENYGIKSEMWHNTALINNLLKWMCVNQPMNDSDALIVRLFVCNISHCEDMFLSYLFNSRNLTIACRRKTGDEIPLQYILFDFEEERIIIVVKNKKGEFETAFLVLNKDYRTFIINQLHNSGKNDWSKHIGI